MPTVQTHAELARENEMFAEELHEDFGDRRDWIITVHFYSLLHYVEQRLKDEGYPSRSHDQRKKNIRNCKVIDNRVKKLYRRLEDVSRDARYECIRMREDDVEMSKDTLEDAKEVLGFTDSGSTKYSV